MTPSPSPSRSPDEIEPELAPAARGPADGPGLCARGLCARGLLGLLGDLLGRIVCGIKGMAPLVFAVGCQSTATDPPPRPSPEPAAAVNVSVAEEPVVFPEPEPGQRPLGAFNITFYYVAGEEEMLARSSRKKAPANDNRAARSTAPGSAGSGTELAAATQPEMVTLHGPAPACEPIAETTREFAYELTIQGTGKLRDGRIVNVWGPCDCPRSPCWRVTPQQWGTAGTGRALLPFRTVAVDPRLIKLGSLLHIPILEGRTMPGRPPWGGYVHDGCVVADDTGGAIRGRQIDLFVGRRGWFLGMSGRPGSHSWARQVPVFDGSKICERKGRKVSRKAGAI